MAGRFVRASKYRHVFGKPTKKEFCYDNLRISRNAWDTNLIKVNPEYLSVNWDASGGGAFAVIPLSERGKLPDQIPLFRGHTASVLDTDWHPFNDRIIASASEDGKVFLWEVPSDFTLYTDAEDIIDVAPKHKLGGHPRKVGQVLFNPSAEHVLASASGDFTIKIWDISTGQAPLTLKHADIVQSLSWNAAGSMLVTTSRDKKVRVWDVRQEKAVHETPGHGGAKNSRAVWMGEHNRFATTGFSRMSERQVALWEPGRAEPIGGFTMLDSISGVCMPFWDDGSNCLYLAGKGDGNIRYFEYENDKFEFLSEHKSPDPQRGIAFIPRRGINVHENEVMRAYKTVNDAYIEPISFTVPRRAESFQADIFPPATGSKAFSTAKEWFDGKTGVPAKIDLESVYEGTTPREVAANYKAPPQPSPTAASSGGATAGKPETSRGEPRKEEARAATATAPSASPTKPREPPPSLDEQKASIFAMASKFQDSKGEANGDDEDETSSFEEVSRPAQRTTFLPAVSAEPQPLVRPTKTQSAPAPAPASRPSPVTQKPAAVRSGPTATGAGSAPGGGGGGGGGGSGLEAALDQIKQLMEKQTRAISAQTDKIGLLATEVEALKKRIESGFPDQSERIRQLELELEEARS